MELIFSVNHQALNRTDSYKPVSDSVEFLTARFNFLSGEWNGLTKTAIFKSANGNFEVILKNGFCVIPWEVLVSSEFSVSVFGSADSVLVTTNEVVVSQLNSGYVKGETPQPPTPTVYEQLIEKIDAIIGGDIPPEAIEKAVEDYLKTHPIEAGITEEECQQIVVDYVTQHKDELKGDPGEPGHTPVKGVDYFDGAPGKDGYTPVKGVDYFDGKDGADGKDYVITASDYNAIADVVLGKLTVAEGQVV